jgi:hypothetical protein
MHVYERERERERASERASERERERPFFACLDRGFLVVHATLLETHTHTHTQSMCTHTHSLSLSDKYCIMCVCVFVRPMRTANRHRGRRSLRETDNPADVLLRRLWIHVPPAQTAISRVYIYRLNLKSSTSNSKPLEGLSEGDEHTLCYMFKMSYEW